MKDVIVFLEAGRAAKAAVALAASIAKAQDALLLGVCHVSDPPPPASVCYAVGQAAVDWVITERQQVIDEAVHATGQAFSLAAVGAACRAELRTTDVGQPIEVTARLARCVDLAVVSLHGDGGERLAELLLLTSGTPCLLVPEDAPPRTSLDRVLIAWDGSREAKRAMTDAMPLLQGAKEVRLVAIGAQAIATLERKETDGVIEHLARHGVCAEPHYVADPKADIGSTLLDQATVFGADLVVMGAYHQGVLRETLLGGVSRTLLERAKVPILMSH